MICVVQVCNDEPSDWIIASDLGDLVRQASENWQWTFIVPRLRILYPTDSEPSPGKTLLAKETWLLTT